MVTTIQASKNVDRQLREERRERIAAEQRRLDTEREAEANTKRVARLEVEKAERVRATVSTGSESVFTIKDGDMLYRITIRLCDAEPNVRATARAAIIALAHGLAYLEAERIVGGLGLDIGRRVALLLDTDQCRAAAKHGVLVSEMRKA